MLLKENPFYILDVSISDNRKKIAEAAEETGFLLGEDICSEAQSVLTNPAKRLGAEMAWFPETGAADIAAIRNSLSSDQLIVTTSLTGYSRLNALVYNLGIAEYTGVYDLGFDIVAIDEQYNNIDISQVTDIINKAREKAGLTAVSENEVQERHRKSIEDIRKLINEKLKPFDEQTYIDFVTVIGEQYVADKRHNAGPILFDIIDQYEIRMQSEIDTKAGQIIQYVDLIQAEQDKDVIRKSIPKVIERVQAWDVYAQPLQCRSQATGLPHQISSKLAYEIRGLIVYLNNEKNMVTEAKDLASAMKTVFIELGEFKEIFTNDTAKLNEIERDQQNSELLKSLEAKFKEIETDGRNLRINHDAQKVRAFCDKVESIHREIVNSRLSSDEKGQLRKGLFYTTRSQAIDLHNTIKASIDCKYILLVLVDLFVDVTELKNKLTGDLVTLDQNPTVSGWTKELYEIKLLNKSNGRQTNNTKTTAATGAVSTRSTPVSNGQNSSNAEFKPTPTQKKPKKKAGIICFIIVALIVLVIAVISSQSKSNTTGNRSSSYSSSSSSNSKKETDKPTTKPTVEPTKIPERVYSSSSSKGDNVYIDIESIYPMYYTYKSDTSQSISDYTCKCTTTSGDTVWVFFAAWDYKTNIDLFASTRKSSVSSNNVVYYYPAARVHGVVSSTRVKDDIDGEKTIEVINYESISVPKQSINISQKITIKTISPTYITTNKSTGEVTHVVCEFTNISGLKDWLYISVDDYKKYIDSTANPEKYADEKRFVSAKSFEVTKIYADSIATDISKEIGQKTIYSFDSSD